MTEVFWHNPHVRGRLRVVDDAGEETVWEVELGPGPPGMEQRGLAAEDFLDESESLVFVPDGGRIP